MNITCLISTKSNITNVPFMFFPYILDLEWRAEFIWILNHYVVQARKHHLFLTSFEVCDTHCKTTGLLYCVKLDRIMLKHDYTLKIWSFLKSFKHKFHAEWIKISIFLSSIAYTSKYRKAWTLCQLNLNYVLYFIKADIRKTCVSLIQFGSKETIAFHSRILLCH